MATLAAEVGVGVEDREVGAGATRVVVFNLGALGGGTRAVAVGEASWLRPGTEGRAFEKRDLPVFGG